VDTPEILHRDDTWMALSKPSGWLVHPSAEGQPHLPGWLADQGLAGWHPVHRLDGATSGVVLFASDPAVRSELAAHFAEGRVTKRYVAIVYGKTRKKGIIRRRLRDARRGRSVDAVTRYRTLAGDRACSLLVVRPETGRKHQIRRHLQGVGHGILGDTRYAHRGRRMDGLPEGVLFLHAWRLEVPGLGEFVAPWPQSWADLMAAQGFVEKKG